MPKISLDLKRSYPIFETRVGSIPLIGYRAFRLREHREEGHPPLMLGSVTSSYVWKGPIQRNRKPPAIYWRYAMSYEMAETKGTNDLQSPGFFMYKNPTLMDKHLCCEYPIYARLSLFGRVIEHELGFRAQYVRIDKLFFDPYVVASPIFDLDRWNPKALVEMMEREYHCDVVYDAMIYYMDQMKADYEEQLKTVGL